MRGRGQRHEPRGIRLSTSERLVLYEHTKREQRGTGSEDSRGPRRLLRGARLSNGVPLFHHLHAERVLRGTSLVRH